jgi:hypothetical protein
VASKSKEALSRTELEMREDFEFRKKNKDF